MEMVSLMARVRQGGASDLLSEELTQLRTALVRRCRLNLSNPR